LGVTDKHLIAISAAAVVLIANVIVDYIQWERDRNKIKPKGSVKHGIELAIRCVLLTPSIILGWWSLSLLIAFGYWVAFDFLFNVVTRQNIFRVGTTANGDKLQLRYPVITYVKFGGAIISIILYIIFK
jgi:hypothetical protein